MAKSRKKFPIVKQEKLNKRAWNRKVRHSKKSMLETALRGSQYKRIAVAYDKWQYRWTLEEALNDENLAKVVDNVEEYWKRQCLRK